VAELLSHASAHSDDPASEVNLDAYRKEWGIDINYGNVRGGLTAPQMPASTREIWLLQRKTGKLGDGLARTTGWARRLLLQKRDVHMLGGVEYRKIDDAGLHIAIDGKEQVLNVDTVVHLRRARAAPRTGGRFDGAGHRTHLDWRCRCGGRARCQARHCAGYRSGHRPLIGRPKASHA
jgi:hypothetical protein